ncbi:hypothetical protein OSH12_11865 [Kaistia terrae]|nr:hypothetical protein [Kaistia terrae]MCX5578972.1 hypothetical protein [Kaistia terrae]
MHGRFPLTDVRRDPEHANSPTRAAPAVGPELVRAIPEVDDPNQPKMAACLVAMHRLGLQTPQKGILKALVRVRAENPTRAQSRRLCQQPVSIAGFVSMRRASAALAQEGDDAGFTMQDFGGAVGGAIVERNDAVHMVANVMKEAGQIPFLIPYRD